MVNAIYFGIHPKDPVLDNPRLHSQLATALKASLNFTSDYEILRFPNLGLALAAAYDAIDKSDEQATEENPNHMLIITDGVGSQEQIEQLLSQAPLNTHVVIITAGASGGRNALWLQRLRGPWVTLIVASMGDEVSKIAFHSIIHGEGTQN